MLKARHGPDWAYVRRRALGTQAERFCHPLALQVNEDTLLTASAIVRGDNRSLGSTRENSWTELFWIT